MSEDTHRRVKALEWHKHERDDLERYSADPVFGQYIITWTASGCELYRGFWGSAAEAKPPHFATVEAAKNFAQADYEARILSALVPDPPAGDVEEIARLLPYVEAFRREEARADKLGREIDASSARERVLVEALKEAVYWHEDQDKSLSKQPNANTGGRGWMRLQHQEQITNIRQALSIQERGDTK